MKLLALRDMRDMVAFLFCLSLTAGVTWIQQPSPQLRVAVHTLPADGRTLSLAAQIGFDAVVELFSWRQIEPTQNQWHWQLPDEVVAGAAYHGLQLIVRLDQHPAWASAAPLTLNAPPDRVDDYVRFVQRVAERYRGRVAAYIIWNEPNLAIDWGGQPPDPLAYTEMLCQAYQAIKKADPAAKVVSAGLATTNQNDAQAMDDRRFLETMLQNGAAFCFDVLGAHPYGFASSANAAHTENEGLNLARIEEQYELLVRYGASQKPVWATEMGWTVDGRGANQWQTVTPEQQADYWIAALNRARDEWEWLELVTVWNLPSTHAETGVAPIDLLPVDFVGYSLIDNQGAPRPLYYALQNWLTARTESKKRVDPGQHTRSGADGADSVIILAPDAVVHLGDSDFGIPWIPLYRTRNPSIVWHGDFYIADDLLVSSGFFSGSRGEAHWRLSLRIMQNNVWDNYIWINGNRLEPAIPVEDFNGSWVSVNWNVPVSWLQPGLNDIALTVGRTLPVLQDERFAWDDIQIKDIVFTRIE